MGAKVHINTENAKKFRNILQNKIKIVHLQTVINYYSIL